MTVADLIASAGQSHERIMVVLPHINNCKATAATAANGRSLDQKKVKQLSYDAQQTYTCNNDYNIIMII